MKAFTYERAQSPAQAAAAVARKPGAKFLAGGTNLLDLMKLQIETPTHLVDVQDLKLDRIEETPEGGLRIGALGSRRTYARRLDLLRHMGVAEDDLARIRGPVGLPIGAMTPPEIATSILAEIVAHWRALPDPHIGHVATDLARMEA